MARQGPDHRFDATALHQPAMRSRFPHAAGPLEDRDKILRAGDRHDGTKSENSTGPTRAGRWRKHNATPPEIAARLRELMILALVSKRSAGEP